MMMNCSSVFRRAPIALGLVLLIQLIFVAVPLTAGTPALVSFNPTGVIPLPNSFVGYHFQPSDNIVISALGAYDDNGDGMGIVHEVGIWDAGMNLLGSVTVTTADPLTGEFRYANLSTPLALTLGTDYYIAGDVRAPDPYVYKADTIVWHPDISYIVSVFQSSSVFGFPAAIAATRQYMAVNMMIEEVVPTEADTWGKIKSLYR